MDIKPMHASTQVEQTQWSNLEQDTTAIHPHKRKEKRSKLEDAIGERPLHTSCATPPPPPAAAAPSAAGPSELLLGPRGGGGLGRGARDSRGSGGGFLLEHGPVKGVVILVVQGAEQDAEQLPQIHVVWGFIKT